MNKIYIHQTTEYGLGNFINLTPVIKMMSDHFGYKIPVYFDLDFVRDCFIDCPFMEIIDTKPNELPYFSSSLINYKNDCPDYIHAYKQITQRLPLAGELPHTYVDEAKEVIVGKKSYTLFIRGSGSEHLIYLSQKMPDDDYYKLHMKLTGKHIFTGSENDLKRVSLFDDMDKSIGDIRKSLALIRDADFIVANDSGLAHAAGAMNKNMLILWKNTSLPKNCNPGKNTKYLMCH